MRIILKCLPGIVFLVSLFIGCSSPTEGVVEDPLFIAADGINGGKLFDMFWYEETGFDQNYPSITTFDLYPGFFRCAHCHGLDLMGQQGGNALYYRSNMSPNIANVNLSATAKASSSTNLFQAIKTGSNPAMRRAIDADLSTYDTSLNYMLGDQMPNYGAIFTDAQIWNLVKFLKAEAVDVKQLYDFTVTGTYPDAIVTFSNIGKDGNAANGNAIYTNFCGTTDCHGPDGTQSGGRFGSIGMHFRTMPYDDGHICKFGLVGVMGEFGLTTQEIKDLFKALNDPAMYP